MSLPSVEKGLPAAVGERSQGPGAPMLVTVSGVLGQSEEMEIERGDLVWAIAEDGERRPARVVIGPHQSGEFEVVVLCEPEDWETVQAERRPPDDYWGEACFVWPVEAIDWPASNSDGPYRPDARGRERSVATDFIVGAERLGYPPTSDRVASLAALGDPNAARL